MNESMMKGIEKKLMSYLVDWCNTYHNLIYPQCLLVLDYVLFPDDNVIGNCYCEILLQYDEHSIYLSLKNFVFPNLRCSKIKTPLNWIKALDPSAVLNRVVLLYYNVCLSIFSQVIWFLLETMKISISR